ncbi:MAG: hypothetical protein R8F63_01365 [Acidimicrobiales bacterium]|nr:hypothetical protein [Acidimicrobiales bacterium]
MRQAVDPRRRRRAPAAFVIVIVLSSILATESPAAAQEDGLRLTGHSVYRVLPDEGVIDVEITFTATNQVPDRREGFRILQTYFSAIYAGIPKDAVDVAARRSNGDALAVSLAALTPEEEIEFADSPFATWEIDLGPNLFYGQTRELTVSFRIPDGGHRNDEAWARVNPALTSFPVVARGDDGRASVRVEFPPGFEVQTFGNDVDRTEAFGATVLEAEGITDPFEWFVIVVASSDFGLARRTVDVGGIDGELSIASWPGDTEWDAFVERGLREGLPILQEAVGTPWPVGDELEIREAIAPALAGYGGWYYEPIETDEDDAAIEVGEYLEMDLLGHELAHAWFNNDFSRARWLTEGLAEYFGVRMARELGDEVVEFDTVTRNGAGSIELAAWTTPFFWEDSEEQAEREQWGYAASYQVIDALVDEIGEEALTAVLTSLFEQENPYAPVLSDPGLTAADWRDVVDAFEVVGGSEQVGELLAEWVLRPNEIDRLDERPAAQDAVTEIAEAEPGWAVPDELYQLLADWRFDRVIEFAEALSAAAAEAQAVRADSSTLGLTAPAAPQALYEDASAVRDVEAVLEALAEQQSALAALTEASARAEEPTSRLEDLGLWGTDVDATVEDARVAFESGAYTAVHRAADDVLDTLDDAESVGRTRATVIGSVALGLLVLLVLVLVLLLRRRRRRRRAEDETAEADAAVEDEGGAEPELFSGFARDD